VAVTEVYEQLCLDALKSAAQNPRATYARDLLDHMKSFKAVFRKGMCYIAAVVERDTGTNLALVKVALNGFIRKVFEVPMEVAEDYVKAVAEALSAYTRGGGGEGSGEEEG
jgi:hypothetical protein